MRTPSQPMSSRDEDRLESIAEDRAAEARGEYVSDSDAEWAATIWENRQVRAGLL